MNKRMVIDIVILYHAGRIIFGKNLYLAKDNVLECLHKNIHKRNY